MRTIHKYVLSTMTTVIEVPIESETLSIQMQNGNICVWMLVDTELPKEKITFEVYRTGWEIPNKGLCHSGTVQDGSMVWHVFEVF